MEENKEIKDLTDRIKKYEENGVAKLYYSLQRKAWEMADLLNSTNLKSIDLDDKSSKAFERIRAIWADAEKIAASIKILGDSAGITGDEKKDTERKPFNDRIAEERR